MKYTFALLAFALSVAIPASAATDYYLVTPFTGTVQSPGCASSTTHIEVNGGAEVPDEISSFTFGGTDQVSATGVGGKLTLQNFVLSKSFDTCSAPLITAFLTGDVIPKVTIYAIKSLPGATTPPTPYLTITMQYVTITQYTLKGSNETPSEQISLAFQGLSIRATKPSGSGTTTLNYDALSNQLTH